MLKVCRALVLGASVFLVASASNALLLAFDDCDSLGCEGSSISLEVTDAGGGDWNVILTLDSTGYTGDPDGVVQAGFKAIEGASSVSLVSFSDGTWSSADFAGIASNGLCAGPSDPGFVCTSGFADIQTEKQYTWTFLVSGGTVLDEWTIKFQYGNEIGINRGHLISAPGTPGTPGNPIPEPSAALVFGLALLIAAPRLRVRR